ncbi:hypothetical protein B7P43_G05657 [Cryptotermes secundus]|uniref:Uncharacterized protein n=1 Tax=Cryptotermes secundus TaxID=105785 RepID=A0A2J7RFN7_9NEOP|nr:hypothetical protein B7P43_G05657 [Cryptotermes secundus]
MKHCLSIARHKSMRVVQMEPVCKFGWATVMQQLWDFFADWNHQLLHQWDVCSAHDDKF